MSRIIKSEYGNNKGVRRSASKKFRDYGLRGKCFS